MKTNISKLSLAILPLGVLALVPIVSNAAEVNGTTNHGDGNLFGADEKNPLLQKKTTTDLEDLTKTVNLIKVGLDKHYLKEDFKNLRSKQVFQILKNYRLDTIDKMDFITPKVKEMYKHKVKDTKTKEELLKEIQLQDKEQQDLYNQYMPYFKKLTTTKLKTLKTKVEINGKNYSFELNSKQRAEIQKHIDEAKSLKQLSTAFSSWKSYFQKDLDAKYGEGKFSIDNSNSYFDVSKLNLPKDQIPNFELPVDKNLVMITGDDAWHLQAEGLHATDLASYGSASIPIKAAADGVVSLVENTASSGGYGNTLNIQHTQRVSTKYGHFREIIVKAGDKVKKGDVIGYMGTTGHSTGVHLHFEIRVNNKTVPVASLFSGINEVKNSN